MLSQPASCPVCGQKEKPISVQGICPACGANTQMSDMLNFDLSSSPQAKVSQPTTRTNRQPAPKLTIVGWIKGTTLSMFIWGTLTGLVCALGLGIVMHLAVDGDDYSALKSGAITGLVLGIILGSTWGAARKEYVGTLGDVLIGMLVGGVWSTLHYLYELKFISPSDDPIYVYMVIGVICGAVAGFLSVMLKQYIDDR